MQKNLLRRQGEGVAGEGHFLAFHFIELKCAKSKQEKRKHTFR